MRSDVNLAVQLGAVAACVALRLLTPGWMLLIFFVFVPIATVALIAHIVLACVAMTRRRLTTGVSLAYGLLAASMLGVAVLVPDGGDSDRGWHSPLGLLVGQEPPAFSTVALLLMVVWFGALIWAIVGLVVTRPRPAAPHPGYGGPAGVSGGYGASGAGPAVAGFRR